MLWVHYKMRRKMFNIINYFNFVRGNLETQINTNTQLTENKYKLTPPA